MMDFVANVSLRSKGPRAACVLIHERMYDLLFIAGVTQIRAEDYFKADGNLYLLTRGVSTLNFFPRRNKNNATQIPNRSSDPHKFSKT